MTTETMAAVPDSETRAAGSSAQLAGSETNRSRLYMFILAGQQSARLHRLTHIPQSHGVSS